MSRFIPCRDMSADQVIQCSYDAMAIVTLCETIAHDRAGELSATLAGDIATALGIAGELIVVMHDTLEINETLIEAARHERTR